MKFCDFDTIIELTITTVGKPAIYIDNGLQSTIEDIERFEFIKTELSTMLPSVEIHEILHDSRGLLFFDNKDEMERVMEFLCSDIISDSSFDAISFDETGTALIDNGVSDESYLKV